MSRKTLYFDEVCGYSVSAVTENGKLIEFDYEKAGGYGIIGNVYKGRVESVLPGMQAAFVNCGLERNCYLAAADLPDGERYEAGNVEISVPPFPELKAGDEIPVQVVKAPVGKKGARVTANPSFVGKCLIYMPDTPFVGVSRRIKDDELRRNLAFSANRMKSEGEGLVVRAAAPYARRNQLEIEYAYLKNLYSEIKQKFARAETGALLYADFALPVRVLRDMLSSDIDGITVGNRKLEEQISGLIKLYPMQNRHPVILHDTGRDMFDETGLARQISAVLSPRVELENGGNLVIEKCEALTVIDVNTGGFTGDYNLEQTVYQTNIAAAREIARQVRLRNISGIVVVDFIDMNSPAHNEALTEELARALKDDKAKCSVSPMSRLGLVEFTRKRTGAGKLALMAKPCRRCGGSGYSPTAEHLLLGVRAKLLNLYSLGCKKIRLDMSRALLEKLAAWKVMLDDLRSRCEGAEVYCTPHAGYADEQINYRTETFDIPDTTVKII